MGPKAVQTKKKSVGQNSGKKKGGAAAAATGGEKKKSASKIVLIKDMTLGQRHAYQSDLNQECKYAQLFLKAFKPIVLLLRFTGRLPFDVKSKYKGPIVFVYNPWSRPAVVFKVTTFMYIVVLVFLINGFVNSSNVATSEYWDMCANSWEDTLMKRNIVVLILVVSWLILTIVMSVYVIQNGQDYVDYHNTWIHACEDMHIDLTKGAHAMAMRGHIEFGLFLGIFGLIIASGEITMMQEGFALIANTIFRPFLGPVCQPESTLSEEMFLREGSWFNLTRGIIAPGCNNTRAFPCKCMKGLDTSPCGPQKMMYLWKFLGFLVFFWSAIGARTFMITFQFYCKCMTNAAAVWNERLKNSIAGRTRDGSRQEDKRCEMKFVLFDHLSVYRLFSDTNIYFSFFLKLFLTVMAFDFCMLWYYFALLSYPMSCNEAWTAAQFGTFRCKEFDIHRTRIRDFNHTFEDPCTHPDRISIENILCNIIFIAYIGSQIFQFCWHASSVFETLENGYLNLTRDGVEYITNQPVLNGVRKLMRSYQWNHPFAFNTVYFRLTKRFFAGFLAFTLNFWILAIQFKPGEHVLDTEKLKIDCRRKEFAGCCKDFDIGDPGHYDASFSDTYTDNNLAWNDTAMELAKKRGLN